MNNIFAAILAGGRSFRLGEDKALLRFNDIYILDYIYSQLTSLTTQIRIIGKPRAQVKIEPGLFVPDRITGLGPLGGLYTALHLTSQPVLVVPCDMPFLNSAHIELLIKDFDASYDAIIAVSSKGLEPLLGIYNPEILSKLSGFIERKDYALYKFINSLDTKYVDYSENACNSHTFFNINTLSDYKKALYLKEKNQKYLNK